MAIRNKLSTLCAVIAVFTMSAAGTATAADGTEKGMSPAEPSVRVVMPEKQTDDAPVIKHCPSLAYGLDNIRAKRKLKKTSVGGDIAFSRQDFAAFCDSGVNTVTIVSLPDVSSGVLKLGALDAFAGQTLAASLLDRLVFVPAYTGAEAEFSFSVNGEEAVSCLLYSQRTENKAPQACSSRVYTKCNVTAFSSLDVTDPENDETECSVLVQPRHGLLRISGDGSFSYKPDDGYVGRDSFVCRVSDRYGAQSEPVTVSVRVERNTASVKYTDVKGTAAEYPAYLLAERGILIGQTVGDTSVFEPEKTVSRGDFVVMAMKASGYSPNVYAAADENGGLLTASQRGYIITAMSAGVLTENDLLDGEYPEPAAVITAADAARIITALGASAVKVTDPDAPLTRAAAAVMLASVIDAGR